MKVFFMDEQLLFSDKKRTRLTVECQQHVKALLLAQAKNVLTSETSVCSSQQQYIRYFEGLAAFMEKNPHILIEMPLLKPDIPSPDLHQQV